MRHSSTSLVVSLFNRSIPGLSDKTHENTEEITMLLEKKNAVIYGAGGAIGGAVARAFAREGARLFLAGRTAASLEAIAEQIRSAGGTADTAQLDALDEQAVNEHADAVAAQSGTLDISFNLISHGYVQGAPMNEMEL